MITTVCNYYTLILQTNWIWFPNAFGVLIFIMNRSWSVMQQNSGRDVLELYLQRDFPYSSPLLVLLPYTTHNLILLIFYIDACVVCLLFLKKKILQIVAELLHERLLLEIIFLFFLQIGFLINILHWQVNVNKALIINQRCCFWLWWNRMDPTVSLM